MTRFNLPLARLRRAAGGAIAALLCCLSAAPLAHGQEPSTQLVKALSYKPRQANVDYEKVGKGDLANCSIEEVSRGDGKGFWVTGPNGQPLRWFADTNQDNQIDRWSYYKAGVEVYREEDTDGNKTADQYRWLSTAGMRKGLDRDEDRQIDTWEAISAEEVTAEVVAATAQKDSAQFSSLLISKAEIEQLGLGKEKEQLLLQRVADAKEQFQAWAAGQNVVERDSRWTNFGADKPGVVPAGTDGSSRDVIVYENAVALLEAKGEARQLLVGTLIKVGDAWRLVELPKAISEGSVVSDGGVFFSASFNPRGAPTPESSGGISPALQRLVTELTQVDEELAQASPADVSKLQARRADVLEKLVSAAESPAERETWIRQFADTISAAAQTGEYPRGVARLQDFARKLSVEKATSNEISYVVFRTLTAEHNQKMQAPKAKYEELQQEYLKNLESFVTKYPRSDDAAEAMIQIGLSAEFSGDAANAKLWYDRAARGFSSTLAGKKAAGAVRRLTMEGKVFQLSGNRLDGEGKYDSAAYLGRPVIYHGWASWCDACKAEMRALKELQAKYAKSGLRIVGINFDASPQQGIDFLKANPFPWVHLYEEGGLDNSIAISNGFMSLPVNVVVDGKGKVIATGVHWTELDKMIEELAD